VAARPCAARRRSSPRFAPAPRPRTPADILAHISDLLDWGIAASDGTHVWKPMPPQAWTDDVARFFAALERFDARLADEAPLGFPVEQLFQGPIADALTHVGQLAMLRRLPAHQYAARTTSERASRWDMWAWRNRTRCSSSTSPIGRGAPVVPSRPHDTCLEAECGFARRCWL
jgi:hypothetical protein